MNSTARRVPRITGLPARISGSTTMCSDSGIPKVYCARSDSAGRVSRFVLATGHPSTEQLSAEQGTGPITDVRLLRGDFWPEEESIEEFLATLHEWRGHARTDPAA